MKLLYKAATECYTKMSPVFRAILHLGIGIFLLQQLASGVLNIWYILEGYMHLDLKNIADMFFKNSYSMFALVSLVCIFGDYVTGLGPKN